MYLMVVYMAPRLQTHSLLMEDGQAEIFDSTAHDGSISAVTVLAHLLRHVAYSCPFAVGANREQCACLCGEHKGLVVRTCVRNLENRIDRFVSEYLYGKSGQ